MFKNFIFKTLLVAAMAVSIVSCSDDDNENIDDSDYSYVYNDFKNNSYSFKSESNGAYILNSGKMNSNNSTLSYYDPSMNSLTLNVFENNQGLHLGDTGNDMLIYGGKIYTAVSTSGIIYITDRNSKLIRSIINNSNGVSLNPRHLTAKGKYVYVSYYGGSVARIDTTKNTIDKQIKLGSYPEGLVVSGNNLYVTNSRKDSTVTEINLNSFTKTKDIKVVVNPTVITADGRGNLFVVSSGDYGNIKNTLQRINSDNRVETIGNGTLIALNPAKSKLYYIYAQYGAPTITYNVYDINSKTTEASPFASSAATSTFASSPVSLCVNPKDGNVFVGVSNYSAESSMYIINPSNGTLVSSFKTGGITPMGIYFLSE